MDPREFFGYILWLVVWGGLAYVAAQVTLGLLRSKFNLDLWLALGWSWVRLALAVTLSILIAVGYIALAASGRATPVGLVIAAVLGFALIVWLLHFGVYGRQSAYGPFKDDRQTHFDRFRRIRNRE